MARAILGDQFDLVHSTFTYKTVSLDIGRKEILPMDQARGDGQRATFKSLMEYYGDRGNISDLQVHLHGIFSFIEFARKFEVVNGFLRKRSQRNNLIIITVPRVKYNIKDRNTHQDYCFYQLLKYSPWTTETLRTITKESAVLD